MVWSDTFSVQRYVSTIPEKNQGRSISFEAKHIFRLSFVSISWIYWIQKRITLIQSWCMQFSWLQNDTKNMVWNLGRKIPVQKYYRVELAPVYINKKQPKRSFQYKDTKTPLKDLSHHSSENSNQLCLILTLHSSFIIDNISFRAHRG